MQGLAGEALGTSWSVRYVAAPGIAPQAIRSAIERRLAEIVAEMSQWAPGSVLSAFNRSAAGAWTPIGRDFAAVLAVALDIAARTNGAFDPTHGRAAALLGYGAQVPAGPPSEEELDAAFADAGRQRLGYDPDTSRIRQPGGLWLDLSGIGKGFAVDAVANLLAGMGIEDALVEIGGELIGRGIKPDGQPWWVDLEAPPGAVLPSIRVALHELAVATSGDYVRGAHTLDPRTGRPLPARVGAVSVVADSAMLADAWATALTVLGPEAGAEVAAREGLAARILWRDGESMRETLSPAFAAMLD